MAAPRWPEGAEVVDLGDRAAGYVREYLSSCGALSRSMLNLPIRDGTSYVVLPEGFDRRGAATQLLAPGDPSGDDLVAMLRYGGWNPVQRSSMTRFVATVTAGELGASRSSWAIFEDPFSSPSDRLSKWGIDWFALGDSVYFVIGPGKHSIEEVEQAIHLPIFFRSVWVIADLDRSVEATMGLPGRSLDDAVVPQILAGVHRMFMKVFDQEGYLICDPPHE